MLEKCHDRPVHLVEDPLPSLRVDFSKRWIDPPLRSQYPALLAVRGGEPLLLPALLPVGEGVVPDQTPGLDHREHPLLLLSVRIQTEAKRLPLHAFQRLNSSFQISTPICIHPTIEIVGFLPVDG